MEPTPVRAPYRPARGVVNRVLAAANQLLLAERDQLQNGQRTAKLAPSREVPASLLRRVLLQPLDSALQVHVGPPPPALITSFFSSAFTRLSRSAIFKVSRNAPDVLTKAATVFWSILPARISAMVLLKIGTK